MVESEGILMTCEELKNILTQGGPIPPSFMVFVYPTAGDTFLANSYAVATAENQFLDIKYIDNLNEALYNSFDTNSYDVFVLHTEEFTLPANFDPEDYNKVIVICNKYKGDAKYAIKFPKLTDDNLKEYMETKCPGLSAKSIDWIYDDAEGNPFKIDNEMRKIGVFPVNNQESMFNIMKSAGNYTSAHGMSIYTLVTAIFFKQFAIISKYFANIDSIDVKQNAGLGIATILKDNIRDILLIQTNSKATAASLGFSNEKFYAVRNKCGKFHTECLVKAFEFLTDLDYRLKSGQLELTNNQLTSYVVTNVMERLYGN